MKKTSNSEKSGKSPKKMTSRQLVALIGVALLAIMYIAALIAAIVDTTSSGQWFRMCLFATAVIPLLIWIYTWMYGKMTGRHTIADPDFHIMPESDISPEADIAPGTDAIGHDTDNRLT